METLEHTDEVFECLYNLAVGLERLLKVAVVLLEHDGNTKQANFESSLVTHNHLELLRRIRRCRSLNFHGPHNEFLGLLAQFYKTLRYDRFTVSHQWQPSKEKAALREFLAKNLQVELGENDSLFATENSPRFRKHIARIVKKISEDLYQIVVSRASELNLYTYELRSGSKAQRVFLSGESDFDTHDLLWKEVLVFLMNAEPTAGVAGFLRAIEPLEFAGEPAEYLQVFCSAEARHNIVEELEELYAELENPGERLKALSILGSPHVYFCDDDDGGEFSDDVDDDVDRDFDDDKEDA